MGNLHIFPIEKFTDPYIEFINKNFDSKEHLFLLIGKGQGFKITYRYNVRKSSKDFKSMILLIKEMYRSEKIFLHGLFYKQIVLMLFIQPWLLKKCFWAVWGGDLYYYKYRRKSIKSDVYEKIRKFVITNMNGLITPVKGDYELAKKWYGAKGKYYYTFMYPSNLYKEYNLDEIDKDDQKIYIQIGNSADPSNGHLEIFKKIENQRGRNIEIICPLSYGKPEYRDIVIVEGKKMFGYKFKPLIDFMPFNEYLKMLAKIDIAIFNHKRQQGMGNITTLLGLGKKVYIRDDITTWEFFIEHGLKVFSSNGDFEDLFEEMDESIREKNINNVKNEFSEDRLKIDLNSIFSL